MPYTGECQCGVIAYRIDGALLEPRSCHCSVCRKAFSGAASAYAQIDANHFAWLRGENSLTSYGDKRRWALGFCCHCGTTVCGFHDDQIHGVTLGPLLEQDAIVVEKHLFVGSKAAWDMIDDTIPCFDGAP